MRELPHGRDWLLVAGLGLALRMIEAMRFGEDELRYWRASATELCCCGYLERFRFSGEIDAIPERTVAFAGEPLVRVIGRRIEAHLLETLLLNQVNFQTAIATKTAAIAQRPAMILARDEQRSQSGGPPCESQRMPTPCRERQLVLSAPIHDTVGGRCVPPDHQASDRELDLDCSDRPRPRGSVDGANRPMGA
ncbi:MAG: hypothetical protein WBP81_08250 [Solirubrobacteraceae bacterium]